LSHCVQFFQAKENVHGTKARKAGLRKRLSLSEWIPGIVGSNFMTEAFRAEKAVIRQSVKSPLKRRLAEVEIKSYVPRENIKIDELIADLISDYRVNSQKSTAYVERHWQLHLKAFFSRIRACDLATGRARRYIDGRLVDGAQPATMVCAGVNERVAMSISGHRRSVFDRYHIVAPSDFREAACKLENSQQQEREALEKSRVGVWAEVGQSCTKTAAKQQNA
jgi:hypothetical protein